MWTTRYAKREQKLGTETGTREAVVDEERREEMVLRSRSSLADGEYREVIDVKFFLQRSVVSLSLGKKLVGTLNSEAERDKEKLMFSATS